MSSGSVSVVGGCDLAFPSVEFFGKEAAEDVDVVHHQLAAECRHVSRSLPKLFCNLSASRADTLASNGAASPPRLRLCEKEIAGRDDANRFIFDAINNYFRQLEHVAVPLFFLILSSSHLADPLDRRICCFLCHLAGGGPTRPVGTHFAREIPLFRQHAVPWFSVIRALCIQFSARSSENGRGVAVCA